MKQLLLLAAAGTVLAQTAPNTVRRHLETALTANEVVHDELRRYFLSKAPALPKPATAEEWDREARRLRQHILEHVVFHGWPKEWIEAPPRFEEMGTPLAGAGYRIRKFRYEIVPGFWSSALLYEPEHPVAPKTPAVLNVNGHVGPPGKAIEYKQKRCIQLARMGLYALNLEWLSYGDLNHPENVHWYAGHLDLAGVAGNGLFQLAMRKGLDYLAAHPKVDSGRLAVTGLSGGGWQTIFLSALDPRVALAIPVAGYASFVSRAERAADIGDIEQNPTDFLLGQDYPHLTALLAPRPALLVYNAEDDCCFRASLVKPYIFDAVRPFYRLYGKPDNFDWHENLDPADHNYQLDNRLAAYRFVAKHWSLPPVAAESETAADVRTAEELSVPLPPDNLTILKLARKMAVGPRSAGTAQRLREVLRYREVAIRHAWPVGNTKSKEVETRSYRFEFANGLSATGVLLRAIAAREDAPATLILHDGGKKAAGDRASDRINRGERVMAADLLFTGDEEPKGPGPVSYAQMFAAAGDRPLGVAAAQLIALARMLGGRVRLESTGMRMQLVALSAAALEPSLFSEVVTHEGLTSLRELYDKPVEYPKAPDLFCHGLFQEFDLPRLRELAGQIR